MIRVCVQAEDFDTGAEVSRLASGGDSVGAVVSFVGVVRGESGGEKLLALQLEHYPGMTERELSRIADEATARWQLSAVTIIHRVGVLRPRDQIVLVVTASTHRQAAFDACAFVMDYLKTQAPFWKKETRTSGEYWIEARSSDDEAAARWDSV
jgi:molybdopterin synthase catalytic subunit